MAQQQDNFHSKIGFIFASAGSAIGLGALWQFPFMTGNAGGGAFFFMFLIFTLFIGLPILLAEYIIGRGSQKDAIRAFKHYAPKTPWHFVGRWGVIGSCILLSFYSMVGGWIILYIIKTVTGGLTIDNGSFGQLFADISADFLIVFTAQLLFLFMAVIVVARGVNHGIEKASKVLMPSLLVLLMIVTAHSLTLDQAMEGVHYFLSFNFADLSTEAILMALGQSFFLLSVGFSNQMTYSSYVAKDESLVKSAIMVVVMNVLVALLAGLAIFPAVFSYGIAPAAGPGLLFVALPAAFSQMPLGSVFFALFLLLFLFAALTSAFPLLEVVVATVSQENPAKRKKWTWLLGLIVFVLGIPSVLSFSIWHDVTFFGKTIFENANDLVSNIMLPVGALFIALFIHFRVPRQVLIKEFTIGLSKGKKLFIIWLFIIKYAAPIAIILAFLNVLGVFG